MTDPTRTPPEPGPYCDNDLENWWVPTTTPYLEARRLVKGCAALESWQVLAYEGRQSARLETDPDHEDGSSCDDACPTMQRVEAWRFRVVER